MNRLIDSHCHLHYDYAPKSTADLIREAQSHGIQKMITVGTDFDSFEPLKNIAEENPTVYYTIGVHPHDSKLFTHPSEDLKKFQTHLHHPKCVAIGEIGLDYYYEHSEKNIQIDALELQLDYALQVNLPVVIHSREAESDLLPRLQSYAKKSKRIPGVIHCFTGTLEFGKACLDAGFYISFSGILTFKTAEPLRDCAKAFPMEKILVETDSPYLAPIPFRGKKCEPFMIKHTALKLSEVKNIPLEVVSEATYQNTVSVFQL